MRKEIEIIASFRKALIALLEAASLEQINKIPPGFNNNLVWQLGHVIAAQQGICYTRANRTPVVDAALIARYQKDTRPQGPVTTEELAQLKAVSAMSLAQLEQDLGANVFAAYTPFTLSTGLAITSIDEALLMLVSHEGLHFGYAQALQRALTA